MPRLAFGDPIRLLTRVASQLHGVELTGWEMHPYRPEQYHGLFQLEAVALLQSQDNGSVNFSRPFCHEYFPAKRGKLYTVMASLRELHSRHP